jgi:glutathione synthase/RimK-type ligase-like ATP-grasp enzyme
VTSPTGIQEIARLAGIEIAPLIWDAIEARYAARRDRRPA